jgi:hypothetical protein
MPKVLHLSGFIRMENGQSISPELMEKIIRKILSLLGRLGCTCHADWRIGNPPEVEDLLE